MKPSKRPTSRELFRSAARVLESPTARLMKAVYFVVVALAERGDLSDMPWDALSEDARRLLGYTAARAAEDTDVSRNTRTALSRFADNLHSPEFLSQQPLIVTAVQTEAYVRNLQERADEVSERWRVYGDVRKSDGH